MTTAATSTNKHKIKLGQDGEKAVERFLLSQGYTVLAKNFGVKSGELDLVAARNEVVCFVEVKTRHNKYFPISTVVTLSKQKKLTKAAKIFVSNNKISDRVLRFDVAVVLYDNPAKKPQIEYIENAFFGQN